MKIGHNKLSEFYTSNINRDLIECRDTFMMIYRGIIKSPKLRAGEIIRGKENRKGTNK